MYTTELIDAEKHRGPKNVKQEQPLKRWIVERVEDDRSNVLSWKKVESNIKEATTNLQPRIANASDSNFIFFVCKHPWNGKWSSTLRMRENNFWQKTSASKGKHIWKVIRSNVQK